MREHKPDHTERGLSFISGGVHRPEVFVSSFLSKTATAALWNKGCDEGQGL